ncbi:hypothetical protein GCM10007036_21210 [Alsobacter metallidurans]|uniref:Sulfotransferase family protein n=1 Tax=Alsobacter metallidurans TaxID=340221 RepID=A0A917MHT1_9HYPH|nr:hypothetical protein GCM10007036_21210 [Alsobacter metallidurans]
MAMTRTPAAREHASLEAAGSSASLSVAQLHRLARLQLRAQRPADAVSVLDEALGKQDLPGLRLLRAEALLGCRQPDAAARELDRVLAAPLLSDRDLCRWAELSPLRETAPDRVVAALGARARQPGCAWTVRLWFARALHAANRSVEAAEELRSCLSSDPEQAWIWYELGAVLRHLGEQTKSQAALNKARWLAPEEARILRIAGQNHRHTRDDEPFGYAQRAETRLACYSAAERVEVLYASAKALEDVGDLGPAFDRYAAAGRAQKQLTPWPEAIERRRLDFLKSVVTRHYIAANRDNGLATTKPIFVFGMPRSGTSLTEEIIARHSNAYGAGETPLAAEALHGVMLAGRRLATTGEPLSRTDASFEERGRRYLSGVERIAGLGPSRIVDKMPGNYAWLGLIDLMLPGSFFVHCRRHPADVCLSAYKLYFGGQLPYSYDLRDLARAYKLYSETMAVWDQVLPPGRIIDVWYEDLVENPDLEAERLVGSLGLEQTGDCLRPTQTPRSIRTASATQAREPIYKHAMGRWRQVKGYIEPLLDELGDEIATYEREAARRRCAPGFKRAD